MLGARPLWKLHAKSEGSGAMTCSPFYPICLAQLPISLQTDTGRRGCMSKPQHFTIRVICAPQQPAACDGMGRAPECCSPGRRLRVPGGLRVTASEEDCGNFTQTGTVKYPHSVDPDIHAAWLTPRLRNAIMHNGHVARPLSGTCRPSCAFPEAAQGISPSPRGPASPRSRGPLYGPGRCRSGPSSLPSSPLPC